MRDDEDNPDKVVDEASREHVTAPAASKTLPVGHAAVVDTRVGLETTLPMRLHLTRQQVSETGTQLLKPHP